MRSGLIGSDFDEPKSSLLPFQFLMGESPHSMDIWLSATVPHLRYMLKTSLPSMAMAVGSTLKSVPVKAFILPDTGMAGGSFLLTALLIWCMDARSCTGMRFLPSSTTALRRLEPITAPRPERAAILPLSVQMPDMSESFSPAGPMSATRAVGEVSCTSISSDSTASLPQKRPASRSSATVPSA